MSLISEIVNIVTGNLADDFIDSLQTKVGTTRFAVKISEKLDIGNLHPNIERLLHLSLTRLFLKHPEIEEVQTADGKEKFYKEFFRRNKRCLLRWILEDTADSVGDLSEWDAQGSPDQLKMREYLRDLFSIIQELKRSQLPPEFSNLRTRLDLILAQLKEGDESAEGRAVEVLGLLQQMLKLLRDMSLDNIEWAKREVAPQIVQKFRNDIKELLEIADYGTYLPASDLLMSIDLCARRLITHPVEKLFEDEYWIKCDSTKRVVDRESLRNWYQELMDNKGTRLGTHLLYVSEAGFSSEALDYAKRFNIAALRKDELAKEVIDFTPYLERVIEEYENWEQLWYSDRTLKKKPIIDSMIKCDLFRNYVPLQAYEWKTPPPQHDARQSHFFTEPPVGTEGIQEFDPIESFFDEWLIDPTRNHVTILGESGSGKSSLLIKLTYEMAKRYLDPDDAFDRIPLYIPLNRYHKFGDIRRVLLDTLTDVYGISVRWELFDRMLERGHVVLLLDGFDEMVSRADEMETAHNFQQINSLVIPMNKSVLTSRTNYFKTAREALATLLRMRLDDPLAPIDGRLNYEILNIRSLDPDRIVHFVRLRKPAEWATYLEQIEDIQSLSDLVTRPILLDMTISSFEELKKRGVQQIDLSILYDSYTSKWIDQESKREASRMTPEKKAKFMERLALEMSRSKIEEGPPSINFRTLARHVGEFFTTEIKLDPSKFDFFEYETRTCSFLTRDTLGNYRFIHRSFYEYFLARFWVNNLEETGQIQVSCREINPETREFMYGISKQKAAVYDVLKSGLPSWDKSLDPEEWLFWRDLIREELLEDVFHQEDVQRKIEQEGALEKLEEGGHRLPQGMVLSPGRWFLRGSWEVFPRQTDPNFLRPVKRIRVDSFFIDKYMVTNEEFEEFVKETGYRTVVEEQGWGMVVSTNDVWKRVGGVSWQHPSDRTDSIEGRTNHPVVQVAYDDAVAYCRWKSERVGLPLRCPTEAEWELAARGYLGRKFPWGSMWNRDLANSSSFWAKRDLKSSIEWEAWWKESGEKRRTTPVGAFPQNALGIFDLAGNAWEWCADWYSKSFYSECGEVNPVNRQPGKYRVIRGGGWDDSPASLSCAWRYIPGLDEAGDNLGFRTCCQVGEVG